MCRNFNKTSVTSKILTNAFKLILKPIYQFPEVSKIWKWKKSLSKISQTRIFQNTSDWLWTPLQVLKLTAFMRKYTFFIKRNFTNKFQTQTSSMCNRKQHYFKKTSFEVCREKKCSRHSSGPIKCLKKVFFDLFHTIRLSWFGKHGNLQISFFIN